MDSESFSTELFDPTDLAERYMEFYRCLTRFDSRINEQQAMAMTVALIHAENALPAMIEAPGPPPGMIGNC